MDLHALIENWKRRAKELKVQVYAVYLAYHDPRVPLHARLFAALVVAYAFSPIDLIPDPIPVLGYLDDLVLVPLGITLALKMIPREVMEECMERARAEHDRPVNWIVAILIIALWILLAIVAIRLVAGWIGV